MAVVDHKTFDTNDADKEGVSESSRTGVYWAVGLILVILPAFTGEFILSDIVSRILVMGMIALSLMFLAGYGGMVSLAQLTIAGVAAYMTAVFGTSAITEISIGLTWWIAVPIAIIIAMIFGTMVGALSVRTEGIYTIMITLAISAAFFFLANQNYDIFNGFSGINQVLPPVFVGVNWGNTIPFYYLCLFLAAVSYALVLYVSRSPFGLALQGIRDNPRRMAALGFNVTAHRIAAYTFASLVAGVGGVLMVWMNTAISPGAVSIAVVIDVLVMAVVGGLGHPVGAFLGAAVFIILETFALDVLETLGLPGERFQLLIGIGFLVIIFWSDDGLLGLWRKWRERSAKRDPLLGDMEGDGK